MDDKNSTLSRRWFKEVWNERRAVTIDKLMSPQGVGHMESGDVRGVDAFKQVHDEFITTLPDLKFQIEGIVSDGDDVVVRWHATGTHTGTGLGLEPTNQRITIRGMIWHRFKDGVMIEGWDSWNQEAFLQRLRERPLGPRPRVGEDRETCDNETAMTQEAIQRSTSFGECLGGMPRSRIFTFNSDEDEVKNNHEPRFGVLLTLESAI